MFATLPTLLLPITKPVFWGGGEEKNLQSGFLSCRGDGEPIFLENGSCLFPFTRITANHFEWQT